MSEFIKDVLSNGLRVVTVEMPHLHSAEMVCYVGVGSRNERFEKAGISHFLEHVLFRGTEDFDSSIQLEKEFEMIGGSVNASVDSETTCFFSRFHPDHLSEVTNLFASLLCRPLFSEVEIERKIILEEALEDFNEEGENICLDYLTGSLFWPEHPLSLPTIGTRESIQKITREDLIEHHSRFYLPRNTVVVVAGKVCREDVLSAARKSLEGWQGGFLESTEPLPFISARQSPRAVWVRNPDSQVGVQLAFRLPGRKDPRLCALKILRRVLAGGMGSRLMQCLREKQGLVYGVEADMTLFAESGCFAVDLAVAPDKLVLTVGETLKVFEEICREPICEEEFLRVQKGFLFDLEFSCDQTDEMAGRYGWGESAGCLKTLKNEYREVLAESPESLLRTAEALFVNENLKAAVVGPFAKEDGMWLEQLLDDFSRG